MDTLRLLFGVDRVPVHRASVELGGDSWVVDPLPAFGMVAVEGNPLGGALWSPDEVEGRGELVAEFVGDSFGSAESRGVSRLDLTTSRKFDPAQGRTFLAGLAAVELPRMETTRRGSPVHSAWWTGARSATIKGRAYCESFKVPGREAFERVRVEDQRRFPNGHRPSLDVAADAEFQREKFRQRWEPVRKSVEGVRAASFPVIAQALADEARYGFRSAREAERLAGALVLLSGGAGEAYSRATMYRRRSELREAGFIVVDDFMEPAEVNLGHELERALEEFGA